MAPDQEASSARLDADSQPPSSGRGPWWLATVGGSSGITALILQDHAVAWAILAGFSAWLIQNVIIAWIKSRNGSPAGRSQIRYTYHRGPVNRSRSGRLWTGTPSTSTPRASLVPPVSNCGTWSSGLDA